MNKEKNKYTATGVFPAVGLVCGPRELLTRITCGGLVQRKKNEKEKEERKEKEKKGKEKK